jgi:DNA-binding response OmpR family regulator
MSTLARNNPLVLILEDQAIIAVDLQEELQDAGYRVAGPFTTCAAARDWLQNATPDFAIVDTVLKDGLCREIAHELVRREVPFLIYSGHSQEKQLLAEFDHLTWVQKPVPPFVLVEECRKRIGSERRV